MIELMREYWDWFLFDTLVWTGALIALALVLRRPVARHLGAGATYALWSLPMLRLLFPPIQLPASMRPALAEPAAPALRMEDFAASASVDPAAVFQGVASPIAGPIAGPMPIDAPTTAAPIDFTVALVALWLLGAAIFLVRRFWLYGKLRRDLLADARPVGEIGRIKLVETPIISGPMAFGVIDKVIALPHGFMAARERRARDLAIAHELAHHRGHDLLVNVLVQPLFAMHWFNPLGWMGWTALRRDQEAACDARVVASRSREERAAYAAVIADFARRPQSAPRPALAAPMACPVLGDKSIIHRLRSLPMTDDTRRRRIVARGTIAAALLALPLTASICYAEAIAASPAAPSAPLPPEAPTAPSAPMPPLAPEAPLPPEAPGSEQEMSRLEREFDAAVRDLDAAERDFAKSERQLRDIERDVERGEGTTIEKHRIVWNGKEWDALSPAERKALQKEMKALRKKFADGGEFQVEMERARREFAEDGKMRREMQLAFAEAARAQAMAPRVVMACKDDDTPVTSETDADGKTTLFVCESFGDRVAVKALRAARRAIAIDRNLSEEERAEALQELDAEIADQSD